MTDNDFLAALGIEIFNTTKPNLVNKVKCLVITKQKFNNEELDLLNKMLGAINLAKSDYIISSDINDYEYKIAFTIDFKLTESVRHFVLNSPKDILADPSLKQVAWQTLKQAQKLLS